MRCYYISRYIGGSWSLFLKLLIILLAIHYLKLKIYSNPQGDLDDLEIGTSRYTGGFLLGQFWMVDIFFGETKH